MTLTVLCCTAPGCVQESTHWDRTAEYESGGGGGGGGKP